MSNLTLPGARRGPDAGFPTDGTHGAGAADLGPGVRRGGWTIWRTHLIALTLTAAVLLLLFHRDAADLAHIWWTSTTFGHCLFIGPVIAWLVWQRRAELARLTPTAWWPGLLLVGAGGSLWLLGDAASTAVLRHAGLVAMLQGAVVTLLGPNVARGLLFPLAYAAFLVPFGEELEPPLQQITVAQVMPLLSLAGVPAEVDGVLIHAGRYWFEVAEACSGAKFVIAMLAFGVLVANLCFTSWRRRALFLLTCLVVPVLANGLRAFGTIYAAHLTTLEAATGADHIVYGWVFFAVVMAGVLALAWRWFDRAPDAPAFDATTLQGPVCRTLPLAVAALLLLALASVFPAWSAAANRPAALPPQLYLPDLPGWHRVPVSTTAAWQPHYPGADHTLFGRYANAKGSTVDLAVAVFARQREGAELVGFGTGVLREADRWVRVADLPAIAGGRAMRITAPNAKATGPVERVVATWYQVGDDAAAGPMQVKLHTAQARLLGGSNRAIAVHLSAEVQPGRNARATVARFRQALGPLPRAAGLE
ncbi:exosortase A [Sphingomonas sp.]|jgi:exosortase A|uniref:exosortase A n=1 Tax=Sphingomonas sp. TaxID=28214 RepID=UPI002D804D37|nr:exosortase A [Sphingomonas sp.]HEU0043586.1 exosortase A [Sphingomonas sp.]